MAVLVIFPVILQTVITHQSVYWRTAFRKSGKKVGLLLRKTQKRAFLKSRNWQSQESIKHKIKKAKKGKNNDK